MRWMALQARTRRIDSTAPSIDENVQKEIAKKVKKSFELRRKSKQLFENTKKAVEMAIEQGEDAALAWLKANVPNLEV